MLKALLLALPAALASSACVSIPTASNDDGGGLSPDAVPGCEDEDEDGYLPDGCENNGLPADCSPSNAAIHPGAFDVCDNNTDEDCSGGMFANAQCGDSIQPVSVGVDGPLTSITTSAGVATFDSGEGFSMTSLVSSAFGPENLLHTGANTERFIGTHMFGSVYSYEAEETVTALAEGRAVTRFQVVWEVSGSGNTLAGTTTHTLFPDGRIHRSENLTASGDERPFVSYITLDPARFTHRLDSVDLNSPLPLLTAKALEGSGNYVNPMGSTGEGQTQGRGCAYEENGGLALSYAWNAYEGEENVRARMPQSSSGDDGHQFAMTLDWATDDSPLSAGAYRGAFLLQLGTIAVAEHECSNFNAAVGGFFEPPTLANADTSEMGDADTDGYVEDGGFYEIRASGKTLELDFATVGRVVPNSYALHVTDLPNGLDPVLFLASSATPLLHGEEYLLHHEDDDSLWVYVDRPMDKDDPLTIVFP